MLDGQKNVAMADVDVGTLIEDDEDSVFIVQRAMKKNAVSMVVVENTVCHPADEDVPIRDAVAFVSNK